MTSCKYVRENLSAYYDNELSMDIRQIIEQHLSVCHDCSAELDEISQIAALCADLPECDLPEGFSNELHEKLVAAADVKTVRKISFKKHNVFFRSKAFFSVAAGILLIFLVGSFYKMGLFSPKAINDAAMAAPSAMVGGVSADKTESFKISSASAALEGKKEDNTAKSEAHEAKSAEEGKESKDGSIELAPKDFGMANGAENSNEVDRSSTSSNNRAMDIAAQSAEIISHKSSTITITNEDTEYVLKTISSVATENGSTAMEEQDKEKPADESLTLGIASVSDQSTQESADRQELNYLIPVDKYDKFISELTGTLGESNVQVGAYVTEDMTGTLEKLRSQLDELYISIEQLENNDNEDSKSKVAQLEKERYEIESQIEQITIESDFTSLSILIYNE